MKTRSTSVPSAMVERLEDRSLYSVTLLANINAGSGSSLPDQFNVLGNQVLFTAYDPARGQMLWKTDGSPAGTTLVKDINPNPQNGTYEGFGGDSLVIGNELYFTGVDAAHGVELWKSDGTADGTTLVDDINPDTDSSYPTGFTNLNGKLAFQALGALWISDGTAPGTISLGDYSPLGNGGAVDKMAVLGSNLYFMRYGAPNADGHSTGELWKTDGTVNGTSMVFDVSPGNDGQDGISSVPSNLTVVGNTLYFAADDGTHGWELWKSDGTSGGTSMVADLAPPPGNNVPQLDGSYPGNLTNVNGTLYFTATPSYTTTELYKIDSNTGQPVLVRPIANGGPVAPQNLTAAGNMLFFVASDADHGQELWRADGTSAGTFMVKDINPGANGSSIINISAVGSVVYFSADDGTHGAELWQSDGTAAGTILTADIQSGSAGSSPGPVTSTHGRLLLTADVIGVGDEPYAVIPPAPPPPKAIVAERISNQTQPTVTGTAPSGSTVHLFSDGVEIGSTTAATNGAFSVQSDVMLTNGKHSLTTSDVAGGQTSAASTAMSFTVDTTPPTMTLVSATSTELDVQFSEDVSASFGRGDVSIVELEKGIIIPAGNIRIGYDTKTNKARIVFKGLAGTALRTGHYRLRIVASKISDDAGNDLASNFSEGFTIRKKAK